MSPALFALGSILTFILADYIKSAATTGGSVSLLVAEAGLAIACPQEAVKAGVLEIAESMQGNALDAVQSTLTSVLDGSVAGDAVGNCVNEVLEKTAENIVEETGNSVFESQTIESLKSYAADALFVSAAALRSSAVSLSELLGQLYESAVAQMQTAADGASGDTENALSTSSYSYLYNCVYDFFYKLISRPVNLASNSLNNLPFSFTWLVRGDWLRSWCTSIINYSCQYYTYVSSAFSYPIDVMSHALTDITRSFYFACRSVSSLFSSPLNSAVSAFSNIFQCLQNALTQGWNIFKSPLNSTSSAITNVSQCFHYALARCSSIACWPLNSASSALGNIYQGFQHALTRATNIVCWPLTSVSSAFGNISHGFQHAITQGWNILCWPLSSASSAYTELHNCVVRAASGFCATLYWPVGAVSAACVGVSHCVHRAGHIVYSMFSWPGSAANSVCTNTNNAFRWLCSTLFFGWSPPR